MSRVLEFADEVSGLTPGLDQVQTITNDFTTTANKNSVFFGSITFNATNPVAVVANSELIFHDADVDFKQGFNLQGTLNWITGCLLYTSPSPRDLSTSRMPSSA